MDFYCKANVLPSNSQREKEHVVQKMRLSLVAETDKQGNTCQDLI